MSNILERNDPDDEAVEAWFARYGCELTSDYFDDIERLVALIPFVGVPGNDRDMLMLVRHY